MGKLRRKTDVNEEPLKSSLGQTDLDAESTMILLCTISRAGLAGPMCTAAILTESVRAGGNRCKKPRLSFFLAFLLGPLVDGRPRFCLVALIGLVGLILGLAIVGEAIGIAVSMGGEVAEGGFLSIWPKAI